MNIQQKREEITIDTFDTCLSDDRYLFSLLQSYYSIMSDEEIEKYYDDAFGDKPDWI